MRNFIIKIAVAAIISILATIYVIYLLGQEYYKVGYNKGYDEMLDSCMAICNRQLKSDTSVTKLVFVHPDTTVYYLYRKTPINKK